MAMRAAALFLFCIFAALSPWAWAIGPTLPLAFDADPQKEPWAIRLRVDPQLITAVTVELQVLRHGKAVRTEKPYVSPDYGKDQRTPVEVPIALRFQGIEKLEPDVYALRVSAEGRWTLPGDNKRLHVERLFYFVVKTPEVVRIDADEYERLTDPPAQDIGADGRKTEVRVGDGVRLKVSLRGTKATNAIPLGPLGGVAEERPPVRGQRPYRQQNRDKSETKEP